jgi:hypothetical protein
MKFKIHFEFRASLRKFQNLNFWDATVSKGINPYTICTYRRQNQTWGGTPYGSTSRMARACLSCHSLAMSSMSNPSHRDGVPRSQRVKCSKIGSISSVECIAISSDYLFFLTRARSVSLEFKSKWTILGEIPLSSHDKNTSSKFKQKSVEIKSTNENKYFLMVFAKMSDCHQG